MSNKTLHYLFDKPLIGDDGNTWGEVLNANFDSIDAALFALQGSGTVSYPTIAGEVGVVNLGFFYDNPKRFGAVGDGIADDSISISNCGTSIAARGGGQMNWPPGNYFIGSDISVDRSVNHVGQGGNQTRIFGTSQRRFKVTGTTSALGLGDNWLMMNMAFDKVSVDFGSTGSDSGRGVVMFSCEITHCDRGIYLGSLCFNMSFIALRMRLNTKNFYFDLANALPAGSGGRGTGSGASMFITDCMLSECADSVYVNGNTDDGFHLVIRNTDFTAITGTGIKTVGVTGESHIFCDTPHFELFGASGVFVENDGAFVHMTNIWALSATEFAWFRNKNAGFIFLNSGRGSCRSSGGTNFFATLSGNGGAIIVDQGMLFTNFRLFGLEASQPCVDPASTGTGLIMASRSGYTGVIDGIGTIQLTNGSPTNSTTRLGEAYDGNSRHVILVSTHVTAGATANQLRFQLADGVNTNIVDITYPLVDGNAHTEISIANGSIFRVHSVYTPIVAGNSLSKFGAGATGINLNTTKFLTLQTLNGGGTASAINVQIIKETLTGKPITGMN